MDEDRKGASKPARKREPETPKAPRYGARGELRFFAIAAALVILGGLAFALFGLPGIGLLVVLLAFAAFALVALISRR